MSVEVANLSKYYGEQAAVDDVSFTVEPGEVVGFLGPNGAGKSTTMKILTCYIQQDKGEATVCGLNTRTDSLNVRRKIGYLPEHNPLYKEMYVREFLSLCCKIYGIRNAKKRIEEVIEMTGLGLEQHKKIEMLSRGYRQRVGLSQAILHDPEVLVLDEPTSGLDPNQIVDIRGLIKKLGEKKTVIFSSHIMQEVEAICDRVLIIDRGKLVMDSTIEDLGRDKETQTVSMRIVFKQQLPDNGLEGLPGLIETRKVKEGEWLIKGRQEEGDDFRQTVFEYCTGRGYVILEMNQLTRNMEQVFQELTGKTA